MNKAQRKRRAVVGAVALLEWRDQMAREDARDRAQRANAEREVTARFETMLAAMRRQAEDAARRRRSAVREDLPAVSHASHYS
jgi:hypothetical protein